MPEMDGSRWALIQDIFLAAADRPSLEQRSYLDSACRHDPALRAEVESLLRAEREAPAPIDRSILQMAEEVLNEYGEGSGRIGAYRLVRQVGRGGMGTVYLAVRADEQFEKRVAIKLIRRGLDTDDMLARFRAER